MVISEANASASWARQASVLMVGINLLNFSPRDLAYSVRPMHAPEKDRIYVHNKTIVSVISAV